MLTTLPEHVNPWQMVSTQKSFAGELPLSCLQRLRDAVSGVDGSIHYTLDFDRDEHTVAHLIVGIDTRLMLQCQRTLELFAFPVKQQTKLGLIAHDDDRLALPQGYEPLLVEDDHLDLVRVVEDELLLAIPLVPVAPESAWPEGGYESKAPDAPMEENNNPFAVLRELKRK